MALSQSLQDVTRNKDLCEFYDVSKEITCKCINCDLFLCQNCSSRIHSKSKASKKHEIVNIKDCENEDNANAIRIVDLENLLCGIHRAQICYAYCNDFDIPACMDCLIDTHKDHEFVEIIDVYNDNLCEKKHFLDNLKSTIYSIQNVEDELQKFLSERKKEYKDLKNNIRQRDKEIKEAVTRYSDELLTQTKTEWNTTRAMIKNKTSCHNKY